MTIADQPAAPIRAVFFDSPGETAGALAGALRSADSAGEIRDGLGRMAEPAKDAVVDHVGTVAGEILDMDVGAIFDRTWPKYAALVRAAEETAGDPDTVRLIELINHQVSVGYEPRVELYLRSRRIATVVVQVDLLLTLRGVLIEIRDGCITGIRAGDCIIDGALAFAGRPVASRHVILDMPRAFACASPTRLAGQTTIA
ncbi:hypothetical protein ACIA5D_39830 [Actinoplanes sp. NPDC051513]|uniref:hypothetical protein n=1 Tax=Actinoplanes sp. NPDC051513 TaxID=3363908 RepID=UPI0037893E82